MYMEWPFEIFQTADHIAMTFEWQQVFRLIYTNGNPPPDGLEFWMGDSRGRWEGDTLVVEVTAHNDSTWFDMAGNFHSEELKLVERYRLLDANTLHYEVTIEDPKVFTRPWKISMPFYRNTEQDRILEYQCQAEAEEAKRGIREGSAHLVSGTLNMEIREAMPIRSLVVAVLAVVVVSVLSIELVAQAPATESEPDAPPGPVRRLPGGTPDLNGFFQSDGGGANYGLAPHPAGRSDTTGARCDHRSARGNASGTGVGEGRAGKAA